MGRLRCDYLPPVLALAMLLGAFAAGAARAAGSPSEPASTSRMMALLGMKTIRYRPDTTDFPNPERGWYVEPAPNAWAKATATGVTLAMRYVRLDRYRRGKLPDAFLRSFAAQLGSVRGTGLKLILRFAYNRSAGPDAPLGVVLEQIRQLAPVLQQYADVIAVVQAGFIGQWGEWHQSTNGLLTLRNRKQILDALLRAVPPSRDVVVRAPYWVSDIFHTGVTPETAFTGTPVSRVGQHDDCFLSGSGTATSNADADSAYVRAVSAYTAMGGETCSVGGLDAQNACPGALEAMRSYHWDYLNADYDTRVIDRWKQQGCYAEISRRLGYRYVLQSLTGPTSVRPGASLGMTVRIANVGFGKMYNPRPMQLVLVPLGGGDASVLTVAEDARAVLPGPGQTVEIPIDQTLPPGTAHGSYHVYLRLPDASPHLAGDPAYSVRLADAGMWVAQSGLNDLKLELAVPAR